jgi:membrane glycosyltransferase
MGGDVTLRRDAGLSVVRELRLAFSGPKTRRRRFRPSAAAAAKAAPDARPNAAAGGQTAYPALRAMPAQASLAMPEQDFDQSPPAPAAASAEEPGLKRNRIILVAGACGVALFEGAGLSFVLGRDGLITPWELAAIVLSSLLGAWLGFGFVSASAGFVAGWRTATRRAVASAPAVGRTAVLLPTYNEDPGLIVAAVQAMAEEVRDVGLSDRCDFFVLSDTRSEAVARAEATGIVRMRARLEGGPKIYYRRRAENTDRKAGNIGEWVERYGGAYDYMLVLDADSLMTGKAMAELVARMDQDPCLGLLQTVPAIINAGTPFARIQQFANRLYGPVFARGQEWWSGAEGNYWGHNAIIRVTAFAGCAKLPHLSGPRPFGGHIMSHDFVEAALLRRRGWAVRTITGLRGSYEEGPPTLLDTAVRDRRWCQGNLQHLRVLPAAGLHWVSRLHLLCGVIAYVAPLLWLALLATGAFVWPAEQIAPGSPCFDYVVGLFALSLALLAAPKAMALVLALRDPELRRGFGGASRLVLGVAMETAASLLMTPVMMVMQSVAVVEVLLGRDSGWSPQHREGVELSPRDAWRAHGGHVLLGALGAVGAFFLNKEFLMWTSPVFLSLSLSALLSIHTSKSLAEPSAAGPRLLQTPEDVEPPTVLARSLFLRRAYVAEAGLRRRIDTLFRSAAAVYDLGRIAPAPVELALVA